MVEILKRPLSHLAMNHALNGTLKKKKKYFLAENCYTKKIKKINNK